MQNAQSLTRPIVILALSLPLVAGAWFVRQYAESIVGPLAVAAGDDIVAVAAPGQLHRLGVDGALRDTHVFTGLPESPEVLALRFDAGLYFANAAFFEEQVLSAVAAKPGVKYVLITGSAINRMDASGEEVVRHLVERLRAADICLFFSGLKNPKRSANRIAKYGLSGWLGIQDTPDELKQWRGAIQRGLEELGTSRSVDGLVICSMLFFVITDKETDQTPRGKASNLLAGTAAQITDKLKRRVDCNEGGWKGRKAIDRMVDSMRNDPWGSPIEWYVDENTVRYHSMGPDEVAQSEDDIDFEV